MIKDHKQIVYNYWQSQEFGKKMIASNNVSDSDLLFLIPNNKKRKLGLPLTRISGKKKRRYKRRRKSHILSFQCFDLIEEMMDERLKGLNLGNEWFGQFVEVKDLSLGDAFEYHTSDDAIIDKINAIGLVNPASPNEIRYMSDVSKYDTPHIVLNKEDNHKI